MKKKLAALAITTMLTLPMIAHAKPITFTTILKNYGGNGAYIALYLTDENGVYKDTIWISGGKSKYYPHLRGWSAATGLNLSEARGITGASTGSGRTLKVSADLADSLIDAGYQIRVDVSVEDFRDSPSDIVVPLTSQNASKLQRGRRYVKDFSYSM
ncbi:MAG: DUF2271 domain-containing protein [OCS116 cluster bacterium]|nr:DUF2271 domain-containing protein [OCS116 cluster bacterium]